MPYPRLTAGADGGSGVSQGSDVATAFDAMADGLEAAESAATALTEDVTTNTDDIATAEAAIAAITTKIGTDPEIIKAEAIHLAGLPQAAGAPDGFGDLAKAVRSAASFHQPVVASLLNSNGASVAADNLTIQQMLMIPSEFVAVRIGYAHAGGSGVVTGAKMLVASTDDIGDLSNAQTASGRRYTVPVKNGTEYNTVSTDGWREVLFGGSAAFNVADAGANLFAYAWSDLITVKSQPVRVGDTARFAGYNPLLVRFFCGTARYTKGGISGFNNFKDDAGARLVLGCSRAGDNIATLANMTPSSTVSFSQTDSLPLVVVAYTSKGEAKTIAMAGDSRFASSAEFTSLAYRTTQFYVGQAAQADGNLSQIVALAQGGRNTDNIYQRAVNYLDSAPIAPKVVVYLAYSINDGVPTQAIMDNAKTKLILFLSKCAEKKVIPVAITAFPASTGFTAPQAALLDDFVNFVNSTGAAVVNPLSLYGVVPLYGWQVGLNFDNDHMTDAGYRLLANEIYNSCKPYLS